MDFPQGACKLPGVKAKSSKKTQLQEVLVHNGWSGEMKPRYKQIRYTQTLFQ